MKKGPLLIMVLLLGVFFVFYSRPKSPGGIELPVQFHHNFLEPLVAIEINGEKHNVFVDLGCAVCDFHFEERVLQGVKEKERLDDREMGDLKGNVYLTPQFRIPEIKIGKASIFNSLVTERNHEYLYNTHVCPGPATWDQIADMSKRIDGKIGLPVFQRYNCLFDFPNSMIVLQDSCEGDKYPSDRFVAVPFSIEKYGIVLTDNTDEGIHRMVLDTGSTYSVIKRSKLKPSDQDKWYYSTNQLVIGGCDYGPWDLVLFDISEKWDIDGCIGADFFLEHAIYLDFKNQMAYIQRPEKFALITQWKRLKFRATQLYRKMVGRLFSYESIDRSDLDQIKRD